MHRATRQLRARGRQHRDGRRRLRANILDQFDRFNCHVICGRDWKSNGDAERDGHKYTAGWFGTNDLMERDDTAAEVAKYADSLEWLDLKDADSLASFGDKCKSEAFPGARTAGGWVIWAPIGKMTASITLEDGTVVKTKATDMSAATGADWGSTAEPAAVATVAHRRRRGGGVALLAVRARSQQNFFSFKMSEPMTMVSGNEYTLTLAFDLEGIVNAYAGVTQPSAPCYPEHPFKLAWSSDRPDGYYTDTACCAEMGTGGAGQPPAAPCATGDRDSCACSSWNCTHRQESQRDRRVVPPALADPAHAVADGGRQVRDAAHRRPDVRQLDAGHRQPGRRRARRRPTRASSSYSSLFVTAGAATPPAAGATARGIINLEGCYYRDRRSELTGDALTPRTVEMVGGKASLYGGRSPWFPLVRGLEVLGSPGDAGSYSLSCLNYWDCTTCANSVDEVKEGLAANRMTFWDSCHSLCFPDNCGECDDFKTNAELIAEVDAGTQSYQSTPRPNAECDAVKAPLANLPYTLADVSVVSGASFTRIALDPSPPSTPPSPPPSASPSPPPSTSPSPPPPDCASPIARWGSGWLLRRRRRLLQAEPVLLAVPARR